MNTMTKIDTKTSVNPSNTAELSGSLSNSLNKKRSMKNKIRTTLAVCVAALISVSIVGEEAIAQTIHLNAQQSRSRSGWTDPINGWTWNNWSSWSNVGPDTNGNHGNLNHAALAIRSLTNGVTSLTGGTVEICGDACIPADNMPANATQTQRRSWWFGRNNNTGTPLANPASSVVTGSLTDRATVLGGHTVFFNNTTTHQSWDIENFAKDGTGTLHIGASGTAFDFRSSTQFNGEGGTLRVGALATYTTGVTNFTNFTAQMDTGRNWNAGLTTARGTVNISGPVAGVVGGTFNAAGLNVGYGTTNINTTTNVAGALRVGTDQGVPPNPPNPAQRQTTVLDVNSATLTTGIGYLTEIGAAGLNDATVNLYGNAVWNSHGQVNVGHAGNIQDAFGSAIAGTAATGVVNIRDTAHWDAVDQLINIGVGGTGTVTQSGGTWTNLVTRVAAGSSGAVNRTGGAHVDQFARIGDGSVTGTYRLSGVGTTWRTEGNGDIASVHPGSDHAARHTAALIGGASGGIVTVMDRATWDIYNPLGGTPPPPVTGFLENTGLVVGQRNSGILEIRGGARTTLHQSDAIIGNLSLGRVDVGGQFGSGSAALRSTFDVVEGHLTVGRDVAGLITREGGILDVTGGGLARVGSTTNVRDVVIGETGRSSGRVNVVGTSADHRSDFLVSGNLTVAQNATGSGVSGGAFVPDGGRLDITAGGRTTVGGFNVVAEAANSRGLVNVIGAGVHGASLLDVTGYQIVGQGGFGRMNVLQGGRVVVADATSPPDGPAGVGAIVGRDRNSAGWVDVDNSVWDITYGLIVAHEATHGDARTERADQIGTEVDELRFNRPGGQLNITGGGQTFVRGSEGAIVGNMAGSVGVVSVGGTGSLLRLTDAAADLIVGNIGHSTNLQLGSAGMLHIYDGARVEVLRDVFVAREQGSRGYVLIEDVGSYLSVGRDFRLAEHGWGTLHLRRGGQATINPNDEYIIAENRDSRGEVFIEGAGTRMTINDNLVVGEWGHGTLRVWDEALVQVFGGDLVVGRNAPGGGPIRDNKGTGVLDVFNWGHVEVRGGNVVIGEFVDSIGRVYVDNATMEVRADGVAGTGTIVVGQAGHAGARYAINRYVDRFGARDLGLLPEMTDTLLTGDPTIDWFDSDKHLLYLTMQPGLAAGQAVDPHFVGDPFFEKLNTLDHNPETGLRTGNIPGFAITRGGVVESDAGLIGDFAGSYGYVVIDNRVVNYTPTANAPGDTYFPPHHGLNHPLLPRSQWIVGESRDANGALIGGGLTIARDGSGLVRVIHGALLETSEVVTNSGTGYGHMQVVGTGAVRYGDPGFGTGEFDPLLYRVDEEGYIREIRLGRYNRYLPVLTRGYRSEWINHGAAFLGDQPGGRTTIRINDGGLGVTHGLYIGYVANSEGTVSVMGAASELHVYANPNPAMAGVIPEGSSSLSVSNNAYVHLHERSELFLNGNAVISNNAVLHLDAESRDHEGVLTGGAVLDAMMDRVTFVNARIEGDGTVTGRKGVFVVQDDLFTPHGRMVIDPGQIYDWTTRDESPGFYGTLIFGDQLRMSGDVLTLFDVNSGVAPGVINDPNHPGFYIDGRTPDQDRLIVQRGFTTPVSIFATPAPIAAQLSGTLQVHARLTDYYAADSSVLVVETFGDNMVGGVFLPGRILSMYDEVEVKPSLFFNDITQEIRVDGQGNQQLWVAMARNDTPFSQVGLTHNTRETGGALDSIYAQMIYERENNVDGLGQDWLPFLRYMWYFTEDELRDAFRYYGGEIRAHSMMLGVRNPWNHIVDRVDLRRQCFFGEVDDFHGFGSSPCHRVENLARHSYNDLGCSRIGAFANRAARQLRRSFDGTHVWGNYIHSIDRASSDGNAYGYRVSRNGLAVGLDRNIINTNTWVGMMFAYNDGRLRANSNDHSTVNAEDFNFGVYHRTVIQRNWEWRNYLGMGYQRYDMRRNVRLGLTHLDWDPVDEFLRGRTEVEYGQFGSRFGGYSMALSTELSRPIFFGEHHDWLVRPFMALDLNGVWQGAASEDPTAFHEARYLALDYHRTNDVRLYWRPGVHIERGGPRGTIRSQVAYSFRAGGRGYTSVMNQFQYAGDAFNQRGVDNGIGFVTVNLGASRFLNRCRTGLATFDYWLFSGGASTTQAFQFGLQRQF